MTTTNTMDTVATVAQIKELAMAGCDYVRITTQNIREAENLKIIKDELQKNGMNLPLIADVHYNPKVAEVAAQFVEKVRINPGNYLNSKNEHISDKEVLEQIAENLTPLLSICKQHKTSIRIGTNHGSLSQRILYQYGNTARGMVESIMEFVEVCWHLDFHNLVLSLKASNVVTMIEANMLLVSRLSEAGYNYPIHLGVTEVGSGDEGRIKSAAGIGYLLAHGIGDTIRVSLTENPLEEVPIARKLVEFFGQRKDLIKQISPKIVYFPKSGFNVKPPVVITSKYSSFSDLAIENQYAVELQQTNKELFFVHKFSYSALTYNDLLLVASVEVTAIFQKHNIDGVWIENSDATSSDKLAKLALNILQVLGLRITRTEYIACPTCGRSTIDVIKQLEKVKEQTSHLPGLKIAVMGCAVNGPGEMTGAHYGYVGASKRKVNLYKGGNIIKKNISEEIATETLIDLIKTSGDWKDIK